MAKVTPDEARQIETLLDLIKDDWESLPRIAEEFAQWDALDRDEYRLEWPLQETHISRLEEFVAEGKLTPEQLARYGVVKQVVERNRAYLPKIFGDGYAQG